MARHDIAQSPRAQRAQKKQGGALQTVLNIFGVILCVIFIPIIIINVVMIVRSYTDPDHIPSVFGYSPVIVLSGSMSPEFETGEMIIIKKVDPATLKVHDVICFMEEETAVTHRIMEVQQQDGATLYITQGDANSAEDATPVSAEQIQGKYIGVHFPRLGDFAIWLQSTPGMLLFVGGPVVLFLLWDVVRRMVQSRQSKKENEKLQAESSSREQEMAAMEEELRRLRAARDAASAGQVVPPIEQPDPLSELRQAASRTNEEPPVPPEEQPPHP